jgi:hypothetical protein
MQPSINGVLGEGFVLALDIHDAPPGRSGVFSALIDVAHPLVEAHEAEQPLVYTGPVRHHRDTALETFPVHVLSIQKVEGITHIYFESAGEIRSLRQSQP